MTALLFHPKTPMGIVACNLQTSPDLFNPILGLLPGISLGSIVNLASSTAADIHISIEQFGGLIVSLRVNLDNVLL